MRTLFLSALASAALYSTACGSGEPTGGEETQHDPALADVIFDGGASEKALQALLKVMPKDDPARGTEIDSPPNKTEIVPSPIPTFKWHPRGATAAVSKPSVAPLSLLPRALSVDPPRGAFAELTSPLRELLGEEREAYAAEEAMSGAGYYLQFSTDTLPNVVRVFTTQTTYTPDQKVWDKLYALNDWTTLIVTSASFTKDSLSPDSGPFLSPPIQFCIER